MEERRGGGQALGMKVVARLFFVDECG